MSAGTGFQCSLLSHPGKTFFMKHLGDEFLRPVNYDKGIGKGHIPQNITSERFFFFLFLNLILCGLGNKKANGKMRLVLLLQSF